MSMKPDERELAEVTFHALVYDRKRDWDRARESLLRFLNSIEGTRYVSHSRDPIVVLTSDPRRQGPYYLHVTVGALEVLRQLKIEFSIFTSAFYYELPSNQVVLFHA